MRGAWKRPMGGRVVKRGRRCVSRTLRRGADFLNSAGYAADDDWRGGRAPMWLRPLLPATAGPTQIIRTNRHEEIPRGSDRAVHRRRLAEHRLWPRRRYERPVPMPALPADA